MLEAIRGMYYCSGLAFPSFLGLLYIIALALTDSGDINLVDVVDTSLSSRSIRMNLDCTIIVGCICILFAENECVLY